MVEKNKSNLSLRVLNYEPWLGLAAEAHWIVKEL